VSAAKPKIGDYPFTTLQPTLGIVRVDGERTFVIADLPGLIPGASEGRGLGHQFLRHTERTRLLVHVLDLDPASGRDPLDDLAVIDAELAAYSPELAARPQLVVANKLDVAEGDATAAAALERVRRHCAGSGRPFHAISAVTGRGLAELLRDVADRLDGLSWARAAS
jgi:GTPase